MQKIRVFNRFGVSQYVAWSYSPEENPDAKEKAYEKLSELNIENAIVYEVAPEVFWYSLPDKKINCSLY